MYGSQYRDHLSEIIRRAAEFCDCLQCFFVLHSMGGGKICSCVYTSTDITSVRLSGELQSSVTVYSASLCYTPWGEVRSVVVSIPVLISPL